MATSMAEPETTPPPAPPEVSRPRAIWNYFRPIIVVLLVLFALRSAVADWNDVPSGSMMPTILEGDRIFVNKLAYDLKLPFTTMHLATWANPSRGDIVVFFSPANGDRLVKRVIAIPGDTIELRENQLIVNGSVSNYSAVDPKILQQLNAGETQGHTFATETNPATTHVHPVMGTPMINARRSFRPTVVPADSFFMMGDNRDNSADSRYFGFVKRNAIVGRAVVVIGSLDVNHHWVPRWHRFFQSLP